MPSSQFLNSNLSFFEVGIQLNQRLDEAMEKLMGRMEQLSGGQEKQMQFLEEKDDKKLEESIRQKEEAMALRVAELV